MHEHVLCHLVWASHIDSNGLRLHRRREVPHEQRQHPALRLHSSVVGDRRAMDRWVGDSLCEPAGKEKGERAKRARLALRKTEDEDT